MTELNMIQILVLTAFAFWSIIDGLSFNFGMGNAIIASAFTGLVVGDFEYGLIVGGTLQLTQLGVGTYGGATVLDIKSAGMITTALGVTSGADPVVFASSLGIGVAALLTLLDILGRTSNTFFQHACDKYVAKGDVKGIARMNTLGIIPWGLSRGLPVFLFLFAGQEVTDSIMSSIPEFLIVGFRVAGKLLPGVGFAILLRYLPTRTKPHFLVLGFILAAYLKISPLGIALFGFVAAYIIYQNALNNSAVTVGGDDYDE